MPATRRRFAFFAATLLSMIAGCNAFRDSTSLQEVRLDLWNRTDDPQTFHFVLESDDSLGQWNDFALDPGEKRLVVVEPVSGRDWSGYHAVAGDEQTSGTLLGQSDERTCLKLDFRIEDGKIVGTLPVSRSPCRS